MTPENPKSTRLTGQEADPLHRNVAAGAEAVHLPSRGTYFLVYLALLALLAATVFAAFIDLGFLNLVITLGIAAVKAALVVVYFMHLKGSDPVIKVFALAGFFWLAILMGLTLTDYLSRP